MINKNLKDIILKMAKCGCTILYISKKNSIPYSTVRNIVLKNCPNKINCSGRPREIKGNIQKRFKEAIRSLKVNGNKVTASSILKRSSLGVSVSTVQRQLKKGGHKYKVLPKKIKLSEANRKNRIETITDWIKKGIDFKKVVFSDEKFFTMDGPNNHKTWVLKSDESPRIRRQAGGGGLMIFGYCTYEGKIVLRKCEGSLNAANYQNILTECLPDQNGFWQDRYFMQDNARPHIAKSTLDFFKNQNIRLLSWPPYSPDLNIIEQIWAILSQAVYNQPQFRSKDQLWEAISKAVLEIPIQTVLNLYDGIIDNLLNCIKCSGNITK